MLDELYREIILDHYRNPHNFGELDRITTAVEHENPVCGDNIKLMIALSAEGKLDKVKFSGQGCAICIASVSIMTDVINNKNIAEAKAIAADFIDTLRGCKPAETLDSYDDLAAFKGVIQFPLRVKCATLGWHALRTALDTART